MNEANSKNRAFILDHWRLISALRWLGSYQRSWLRGDVVAGITLAAYLLPSAIGDASLAGLPPEAGLYACLFAGLVFWLFCSSRHTAISVTSAISLLLSATLGDLAQGEVARYSMLASATAILVGIIAVLAWLIRAGAIVNFISESVMVGFKGGVALFLASSQIPKLFGFHGAHGDFWENAAHFLKHLHETNAASLAVGLIALTILILGKIKLKQKPVALFVVVGSIILGQWIGLDRYGVSLLGEVPAGLPAVSLPRVHWSDLNNLLPLAFACFLLGAVETAAIGRMFIARHGGRFDANQEFLALGMANLAAGLGQGFPVSGGMSQSMVNESSGAKTPLSGAVAAMIILLVVVFLSHLLKSLPQPVLAAVVLVAVAGLFKVSVFKHLWSNDRPEFIVAVAALLGVLSSGLLRGVMIGVIISLVQLIRRVSRPHIAILGRIPGTQQFSDHARHPENELISGVMIFRPESSIHYFNVDFICDYIADQARRHYPPPQLVVIDFSAAPSVDLQSCHTLALMLNELIASGIRIQAVEVRSSVRERLRKEEVDISFGEVSRGVSLAGTIKEFCQIDQMAKKPQNS